MTVYIVMLTLEPDMGESGRSVQIDSVHDTLTGAMGAQAAANARIKTWGTAKIEVKDVQEVHP